MPRRVLPRRRHLAILGTGIGLSNQVLILIAQNAFPEGDLGVATATVAFSARSAARSASRSSELPST
jgi:hypothetical protein